jgi:hypothetical protein
MDLVDQENVSVIVRQCFGDKIVIQQLDENLLSCEGFLLFFDTENTKKYCVQVVQRYSSFYTQPDESELVELGAFVYFHQAVRFLCEKILEVKLNDGFLNNWSTPVNTENQDANYF